MFDDLIRKAAWQEYQDLAAAANARNADTDAKYFDSWDQDRANARATGRIPQPKLPYHQKVNVVDDGNGWPKFSLGPEYVFTEPAPAVAPPDAGQTLVFTDAAGTVHHGKVVNSIFGHAVDWGI